MHLCDPQEDKWCSDCRYRGRNSLQEPCATGHYQMWYCGCCNEWKPRTWCQRLIDLLKKKICTTKAPAWR